MKCVITYTQLRTRWLGALFAVTLLVISLTGECLCTNSITVESKSVASGASEQEVGIRISNELDLQSMVLPLMLREIDNGSFISGNLSIEIGPRIDSLLPLGLWQLTRRYSVSGAYNSPRHTCPIDSTGHTWNPADSAGSLTSPEALIYVFVQENDTVTFVAGSDSLPGYGAPTLTLNFGVTSAPGLFEIDTTCIPPNNHALWVFVDGATSLVPSFFKGIVEIGGPFWRGDSISGHVTDDQILRGDVTVVGDLTIDAGVTLTLLRGSALHIADSDSELGGLDTTRAEIIVNGILRIDDFDGARPILTTDSSGAGAWYGIRVMPGGRFESGIGAVIQDAMIGVTIASGASADTLSGLTIQNCDSIGIWNSSSSVALINDTITGPTTSIGVYLDSAGPLVSGCCIDSCTTGIRTRHSWSTIRDSRVVGPGVIGVHIDNEGGLILEGKQRGPRVPTQVAALGASRLITLKCDTIEGYFSQSQLWMEMYSNACVVDSCGFIHPAGTSRSPYGLYLGRSDTVTVRRTSITGFGSYGVYSALAKVDLGKSSTTLGINSIYSDTTGCGACLLKRVYHLGTDTLKAEGNWWGATPPLSTWFSAKVDYNPYSTEPLGKLSTENLEGEIATTIPREHHLAQNYPNPFNSSTEIEFALAASEEVTVEVYNILGQLVKSLVDREFPEGTHRVVWDATTRDGQQAASGVYLYRIVAGDFVQSKKMLLLK